MKELRVNLPITDREILFIIFHNNLITITSYPVNVNVIVKQFDITISSYPVRNVTTHS